MLHRVQVGRVEQDETGRTLGILDELDAIGLDPPEGRPLAQREVALLGADQDDDLAGGGSQDADAAGVAPR
jgi:hypothetical protein